VRFENLKRLRKMAKLASWQDSRGAGSSVRSGSLPFVLVFALAVLLLPVALTAQESGASPFLPRGHWAASALERLQGAGLIQEGFDPAGSTVTRLEAFQSIDHALAAANERGPEWEALVQSYRDRLAEEFPETAQRAAGVSERFGSEAALLAGLETRHDGLLPRHLLGDGGDVDTKELRNVTQPVGALETGIMLPVRGRVSLAGYGVLQLPADRVYASEAYGVLLLGNLGIWGGRRHLGFGAAEGGSAVLNSEMPFDGGGLFLQNGSRLPVFLRHLGSIRLEISAAPLDQSGGVVDPWFFATRLSLTPHPRVRLGMNRATAFGGEHDLVPSTTFRRVMRTLLAVENDEYDRDNFEDHVGALDVWFAPSLGSLPLAIYGEWAVGDLAEQKTRMPGLTGGLEVPGFPGAPWLSLGFETTSFGGEDGRRPWYDHRVFGTWTDDGRLRAHGLGGEGTELRLFGGADLLDALLRIEAHGLARDREDGNLFAPEREGSSKGFGWTIHWRVIPSMDVETSGVVESGSGWTEGGAFLGARLTL
jgi:hypothetical protein